MKDIKAGDVITKIGRNETPFELQGQPTAESLIGTMILFPSYVLHRVSEVTKGTRYSLVGWAHGNSFI